MTHEPEMLVPQTILDAWEVPEMPEDMKERVMTQLQEPWRILASPEPMPRGRGAVTVTTFTAVAALAASVAAVVIGLHAAERDAPAIAPGPPVAVPVAVSQPAPAPRGHLTIATDPPDAICEVDGVAVPGPSPFVVTGLEPGPHAIRVHREGNEAWTRTIDVPPGQLHVPIDLQPGPDPKEIAIAEAPPAPSEAEPGEPVPDPDASARPRARSRHRAPQADPLGSGLVGADVRGGLDRDVIRRVVRTHIDEVRSCYNGALVRDPSLAGRVAVQFTIGPTGRVTSAITKMSTLSDRSVAECITKAVKRWPFPEPEGGGNVVVTYPFVLEPG